MRGTRTATDLEEARGIHAKCLAGRMKVRGEDHKDTLGSLNNLGAVYDNLRNFEKALWYFEKDWRGVRSCSGKRILIRSTP
ncbi:hypothetical protein TL16_g11788 [Triparma laevis f. inornata]|uniref:Uncharacterized protein n=1 Tax=Triparma laevis f. inornata TaxID=1714386 RepID=A0A9W7EUG8_9STRA|nr:hypothetical protein TL16_g11788 [Triparma laevis f. inornata]